MNFFSKFVDYVYHHSIGMDEPISAECNLAEDKIMTEHFDKYYAYEYGDFAIRKTRFGVFTSYDRELLDLVTAGTYEACMHATLCHLKWAREGYVAPEGKESTSNYSATVGGKL